MRVSSKTRREQEILIGLIDLYLKSGKPIGSQTLQEAGFKSLSSATIRNYFGKLEGEGFLKQPHTSGGRVPTDKALRLYANLFQDQGLMEDRHGAVLGRIFEREGRDVFTLLHQASEGLSELSRCAVFISAPRFDQDVVQDVRLIALSSAKLLVVLMTDFGFVRAETLYLDEPIEEERVKQIGDYFLWRLNRGEKPHFQLEKWEEFAQGIYNEVMVRHVVGYASFPQEDVWRAGLSKLLVYPEFHDAFSLVNSLSLLEDAQQMRHLLRDCCKQNKLVSWIGDELCPVMPAGSNSTVLAIPYRIHHNIVGAVAILGPTRLPYRSLFGLLQSFSEQLSQALTQNIYKFKMTFREPSSGADRIGRDQNILVLGEPT